MIIKKIEKEKKFTGNTFNAVKVNRYNYKHFTSKKL